MTASWHVVAKLLTVSRMSKVDYWNKVLPSHFFPADLKTSKKSKSLTLVAIKSFKWAPAGTSNHKTMIYL